MERGPHRGAQGHAEITPERKRADASTERDGRSAGDTAQVNGTAEWTSMRMHRGEQHERGVITPNTSQFGRVWAFAARQKERARTNGQRRPAQGAAWRERGGAVTLAMRPMGQQLQPHAGAVQDCEISKNAPGRTAASQRKKSRRAQPRTADAARQARACATDVAVVADSRCAETEKRRKRAPCGQRWTRGEKKRPMRPFRGGRRPSPRRCGPTLSRGSGSGRGGVHSVQTRSAASNGVISLMRERQLPSGAAALHKRPQAKGGLWAGAESCVLPPP